MSVTYRELERNLVQLDGLVPFDTTERSEAASVAAEPALARLAERHRAVTMLSGRSMTGVLDCIRGLSRLPAVRTVDGLGLPGDRRVVVAAHGPSLAPAMEVLRRQRERVHLIAPFRTAVRLVDQGVVPDVAVLADRGAEQYEFTIQAWKALGVDRRALLSEGCELVAEPFAPLELYRPFDHVRFFDFGLDVLPPLATLPFWGYALLTSVCLPLAAGATRVALVGVDLTAADGVERGSWAGPIVMLDPRMQPLLELLETVARCEAHLIDTGSGSVRKRGYSHMSLESYLAGAASYRRARVATDAACPTTTVIERLLQRVENHIGVQDQLVDAVESRCQPALEIARSASGGGHRLTTALAAIVEELEVDWPRDSSMRAAVAALQPTYLLNLWQLRGHPDVTPIDPVESARKKALLVFSELSELAAEHRRMAPELRTVIRDVRRDLATRVPPAAPIQHVGIVGTGSAARAAAEWLAERHDVQPAAFFRPGLGDSPDGSGADARPLDDPFLASCDLLLLAADEADAQVADALRARGLREYDRFLRFRPGSPQSRPALDDLLVDVDRLNVTELDDLAQAIRRRVLQRCSLRADYWVTLYTRFVHELRDLIGFDPQGRSILEIGTGSGFGPLILFNLAGARRACTCDFQGLVKPYAAPYRELLARVLLSDGVLATDPYPSPDEIVSRFSQLVSFDGETARFDHGRLAAHHGSVSALPYRDNQFDLVYSNAVLEHVVDVEAAIAEMKRVLRPGGIAAHRIDLSDHAVPDEPHQFLRYSDTLWHWLNRHHVYTENRLRRSDFLALFETAGFTVVHEAAARTSPVTDEVRAAMHPRFQRYDSADLAVVSTMMVLCKP